MNITLRPASSRNTQCHWVGIGGLEILFSYEIPIAFIGGGYSCRRNNDWGSTTNRHMRETDILGWPVIETETEFLRKMQDAFSTSIVNNILRTLEQ